MSTYRTHFALLRSLAATLFVGLIVAGCAINMAGPGNLPSGAVAPKPGDTDQAGRPASKKNYSAKVALLLPTGATGRRSAVASAMKQAAELAVFENNNPGFQLVVKDSKGTPEGAVAAAETAIRSGAELILGPLTAAAAKAVHPVAAKAGVPVIAFSNDATIAGNGLYLLSFLVQPEVDRIVGFAAKQGHRRFAALISNDPYGKATERAFRSAVARVGGTVVALENYPINAARLLEPTQRLMEAIKVAEASGNTIDAVFLPGGPNTLPNIGPLIAHANMDIKRIKLLGTGGWEQIGLAQSKPFVGGWFPAPDPRGWQQFSSRYVDAYGMSPPRIATLAYDAVSIAIGLSSQPRGKRYSAASLTNPRGFAGTDGQLRFNSNGTSDRQLGILEVQTAGPRLIEPPQAGFSAPTASGLVTNGLGSGFNLN